jgi:hypothetical protein
MANLQKLEGMLLILNSNRAHANEDGRKAKELLMKAKANFKKLGSALGEAICLLLVAKLMSEKTYLFAGENDEETIFNMVYENLKKARTGFIQIGHCLGEFVCLKYLSILGGKIKGQCEQFSKQEWPRRKELGAKFKGMLERSTTALISDERLFLEVVTSTDVEYGRVVTNVGRKPAI